MINNDHSYMQHVPLEWLGSNGHAFSGNNYASPNRDIFYELILRNSFSDAVNMSLKPVYKEMRMFGITDKNLDAFYSTDFTHFRFDPAIWQQYYVGNAVVLRVPSGASPPKKYASLYLNRTLEKGRKYTLIMKFRLNTASKVLNLHIKASEDSSLQIIGVYKVSANGGKSEILRLEFVPDCDIYDEFMIGASQISGENNYFALEYLFIL